MLLNQKIFSRLKLSRFCIHFAVPLLSALTPNLGLAQYTFNSADFAELETIAEDSREEANELIQEAMTDLNALGTLPSQRIEDVYQGEEAEDLYPSLDDQDLESDTADEALEAIVTLTENIDQLLTIELPGDYSAFAKTRLGPDESTMQYQTLIADLGNHLRTTNSAHINTFSPLITQLTTQLTAMYVNNQLVASYGHQAEITAVFNAINQLKYMLSIP